MRQRAQDEFHFPGQMTEDDTYQSELKLNVPIAPSNEANDFYESILYQLQNNDQ